MSKAKSRAATNVREAWGRPPRPPKAERNDIRRDARLQAILQALEDGPKSMAELSALVTITQRSIRPHLARLRYEEKLHIGYWIRNFVNTGCPTPYFRLGKGADAPYPEPIDNATKKKRERDKLKKDMDAYDAHLARERILDRERRGQLVRRDPLVEALFGKAKNGDLK